MCKMRWDFDGFADELEEQAKKRGFVLKDAKLWQEVYDGIFTAWINECLTQNEYENALKRLAEKMDYDLESIYGETNILYCVDFGNRKVKRK